MTPYYADPRATLWQGDCRAVMAAMEPGSVHCVVTSPPYLGLRAYAGEQEKVWGGDPFHDHEWGPTAYGGALGRSDHGTGDPTSRLGPNRDGLPGGTDMGRGPAPRGAYCACGSWRGALGLEPSIGLYVKHIVEVMRGVRRVMRDDATLWLNIGDSYATHTGKRSGQFGRDITDPRDAIFTEARIAGLGDGLPEKSLMMIPARVAIAMQDDGWVLRSDICWVKASSMPESVTDRPSSAWEHIFLFAKRGRYFWDAEAVKRPQAVGTLERFGNGHAPRKAISPKYDDADAFTNGGQSTGAAGILPGGANLRNFWLLSPESFPEAHFATFPTEIPRRAILAGTSAHGVCSACGAPWRRVVEKGDTVSARGTLRSVSGNWARVGATSAFRTGEYRKRVSAGWEPTCDHAEAPVVPATVFDPFAGSGTTLMVARALGRIGWGADLSEDYCRMAVKRIQGQTPAMALG